MATKPTKHSAAKKAATKKPAEKKVPEKKPVEKKVAEKKPADKKQPSAKPPVAAEKSRPAPKPSVAKPTVAKAPDKSAKAAAKPPTKTEKDAKNKASKDVGGVTVTIGPRKPALAVAPGARIAGSSGAAARRPAAHEPGPEARKLTKKELEEIRELLIEKRDELLHGIKRELADSRERSSTKSSDEADKATDAYDEELSFELATTSDEELSWIETALAKIKAGTYGHCEACNCQISLTRLKIMPYAITCVACRDDEEQVRKREESPLGWGIVGQEEGDAADEPEV